MTVTAKLYVMPGSHPSTAARLMLDRKGIEYRQTWLLLPFTPIAVQARGFPRGTVPALRIGRRRLQGSREISLAIEEMVPDPPLFPADPAQWRMVEEAERWGDELLQDAARRIEVWQMSRDSSMVRDQLADARRIEGARVRLSLGLAGRTSGPTVRWYARRIGADDDAVRRDLAELPSMLDRIDAWIGEGVLGGAEPNAADYQIAPSLRLLMTTEEIRPAIAPRPAGRLALRLVPDYPGEVAGALPQEWLGPLAESG